MSVGQLRSQWEPVTKQFISIHGPLDQPAFYFDPRYDQGDFKNPVPSNVARGHNGVILPGPPREGPPDDGYPRIAGSSATHHGGDVNGLPPPNMLAGVQYGPPSPRSSHGRDMYGQLPPNMQERSRYGQPPPSLQNNETPSPAVPIYLPHPSPPLQVERTPSPTIPIYLPPTSPPPDADFSSRTSSHHALSISSSMQVQPSHSERGYTHHPQHCSSATHSTSSSMQVQPSQSMRGPAPTHHVHKPTTHHMPKASTKPDQLPSSRSVHHPKCHMCQTHGVSVIEEGVKWCNPCFEEAKKRRPGTGRAKVSRPACVTCQRNLVEVREGEVTWCKLCFGEAVRKRPGR